jgi:hypothetical protein
MAYWLIQTNAAGQEDYLKTIQALKDENAEWCNVKLRPFTQNVQRLPKGYKELPVVPLGSVNLAKWGRHLTKNPSKFILLLKEVIES